jgi:aspartyl-tRNA(Asn)/glutamyl-tRNA(Gln) amidotransferase subunit B
MDARVYETVIGLEVHAQLQTKTKLFSGDQTSFGAAPNAHISPVTLGYPGTLPVLNKEAVRLAAKMGIACHCEMETRNYFARKNYFYPDLPKGYQISQHTSPICKGGYVPIGGAGEEKNIQLNRIHLEEDAGKSIHDKTDEFTSLDFNRAGVPLIEIVTEPCISSADEAVAFLSNLRRMLRYLDVCDGNMEEGSLRCDANVSIRIQGQKTLGVKVEIKNLNSIRHVKKAIEFEVSRMRALADKNEPIVQETRSFEALDGTTFSMRSKEEANDYRYFPDPDLPPFDITEPWLEDIKKSMPELPEERMTKYMQFFKLSRYDAEVLTDDKETAVYFEALTRLTPSYKAAANWMLGPVKSYLNEQALTMTDFRPPPAVMAALINLVEEGRVHFSTASSKIFPELASGKSVDPESLAISLDLIQTGDESLIQQWVNQAIENMPDKVLEYKKGKKGLLGLFVGEVKKMSKGTADPLLTNKLLLQKLEK